MEERPYPRIWNSASWGRRWAIASASASGVSGDPSTYYAGAASGGVWKSTDGGAHFAPVFDSQPVQAIGALAVSTSDPNIVWVGTGEAWAIRDSDMMGDGVYKSTDAGRTWTHMGLDETGRIARIVIHPTDPDIVYVCAAGRLTGPQQERGVFKTTDGGKTWTQSLFVDPNTGCSGLTMDAHDPNTLFAGTWQVVMHTYAMFSGGPGSGVYVTHDGGAHWKQDRRPRHAASRPSAKIDVAVAPSDSKRVYALIQTADQGSIWRSDDGGENWTNGSWQRALIGRAGYYIHLAVSTPRTPMRCWWPTAASGFPPTAARAFRDDALGRRYPRYLDRPQGRQAHHRHPRRRHVRHQRPRRHLHSA